MLDTEEELEKEPIQSTENIRIKPVMKGPSKIALLITLLLLGGFGGHKVVSMAQPKQHNIKIPNQQISEVVPDEAPTPAPTTTPEDLIDGESPDKKVDLKLLGDEITKQLNNHYYSRRNYLLRKAGDQVASGGKNYEYYLIQELVRVREELKTELLQNNQKSVSGIGGEFGADAEQSEKVRSLYGDLMAVVLAFDYIYQLPSEAKPDADALISRVSIGETLNRLLNFEVSAKRDIQSQVWQLIERSNERAITDKELEADGKELEGALKK